MYSYVMLIIILTHGTTLKPICGLLFQSPNFKDLIISKFIASMNVALVIVNYIVEF